MGGRGGHLGLNGSSWQLTGEECIMRSCVICTTHHLSFGVSIQEEWDGLGMQQVWKQGVVLQEFGGEPGAIETTWAV